MALDASNSFEVCQPMGASKPELTSDYRVQELLAALNEGLLDADFVRTKLAQWAGDQVDLICYSDGEYVVLTG
jgi:hypothetical protein